MTTSSAYFETEFCPAISSSNKSTAFCSSALASSKGEAASGMGDALTLVVVGSSIEMVCYRSSVATD